MYNTVSSTQLKQNTRKVLDTVVMNPGKPTIVFSYREPKVVIVSYEEWENSTKKKGKSKKKKQNSIFDRVSPFVSKKGPKIDSTKIIRRMRDEE